MSEADRIETYLRAMLDRVDNWLRFAEVKNGGVIALSATVSTALLAALRSVADLTLLDRVLFTLAMVLFLLSMATALYSYLPRTRPGQLRSPLGAPQASDNLFYHGDLAKYSAEQLVGAVARHYVGAQAAAARITPSQRDLAGQVTVNSRITMRKLRLFERGGLLALLGSVAYAAALIVRLLGY